MTRVRILGVDVEAQRYESAIAGFLEAAVDGGAPRRAHFATVHSVTEAVRDPRLRDAFATAWMVCTDGLPLAWVARLRGVPADRVCGPDVMLTLCDRGRAMRLRHYFLGGASGVAERLAHRLSTRFPGLDVVGTHAPPFRALSAAENASVVDAINSANPDIVWVGLGAPKQELWAADHEGDLRCRLILPVGAAFDFHSGRVRRAPAWMRRLGLEWLFRLAMEPRRLFKRYVVTNARFVYLLALDALRRGPSRPG